MRSRVLGARGRGSSPLARGLQERPAQGGLRGGIIPARAGFTPSGDASGLNSGDHPRSRGVYRRSRILFHHNRGSSPLARGLLAYFTQPVVRTGIIPARAGFTVLVRAMGVAPADHPRSRGVYVTRPPPRGAREGSSPLARGLQDIWHWGETRTGIIPARAGFTKTGPKPPPPPPDHPRSRGVYGRAPPCATSPAGSSPLARGLPSELRPACRDARIIPARAGFTAGGAAGRSPAEDHPRSRGVYPATLRAIPAADGSSPLARGLRSRSPIRVPGSGIIPARAGFTPPRTHQAGAERDHPRSRGVYPSCPTPSAATGGSSPLARGLHRPDERRVPSVGIIPARAGFTPAWSISSPTR